MARTREPKNKPPRSERSQMKIRMRSFIMFLPNLVRLLGRLLKDSRVPTAEKALFIGAIAYVISPVDLIPDVLPFIGQVDDIYLVSLVLLRLLNRTDASIVREHWSGGGDIVSLARSVADLAPKLLPARISRVLTSRVELAPAGQILGDVTSNHKQLVRELPEPGDTIKSATIRQGVAVSEK